MPVRLALCDLGAPGWGEPWFSHSAVWLYSQPGMAMLVMFLWSFVWFTAIPNIGMIQCYCDGVKVRMSPGFPKKRICALRIR